MGDTHHASRARKEPAMTSLRNDKTDDLAAAAEQPTDEQSDPAAKVSKVEQIKLANEGLGGLLFEEVPDLTTDRVSEDAYSCSNSTAATSKRIATSARSARSRASAAPGSLWSAPNSLAGA